LLFLDALVSAAILGSIDAVDILLQVVNDPSIYTEAFNAMTASGELWLDKYYFSLVEALLSRGTADEGVHSALVTAIGYVIQGAASPELLELLLSHDADVNFDHGKALQLVAESAREDLLEMLLRKNLSSHSIYMSLQTALRVDHEEEIVFHFFISATENGFVQEKPDVNSYSDLGYPLLFYCLNNYPASARLARKICELNADLSATLDWDMFENEYDEPLSDGLTPLLIALEKDCSDDVIGVLLDHGGEFGEIFFNNLPCPC
jgi:ankyrin repeat protein